MLSTELRVDRRANLVERLALLLQPYRKASLTLTLEAIARHSVTFVTGEERIEFRRIGASTVAPNAVYDLRNLAYRIE